MTTHILVPGLLSDGRVWRPLGEVLKYLGPVMDSDVTRDASIPAMASRLLDEADGPFIAIGHSMGGRVAMEMARQAPDRVRALVLSSTGHGAAREGEEAERQAKIDLGHADMDRLAAEWVAPMLATGREPDLALLANLSQMARAIGPVVHERQIRALLGRPDASLYLPKITCPVLLMTGAQDSWSPEAQHREIAALIPDNTLHIIDGAGHFLPCEKPQDTAEVVLDWLTSRKEEIYV